MRAEPFAALRYDPHHAGPWQQLLAPPYDQLDDAVLEQLLRLCPYNVAQLTVGSEDRDADSGENRYRRAARLLREWRTSGILAPDPTPAFYAYRIDRAGGAPLWGFLGMGELSDYQEGQVLPHEGTLEGPKQDRLELLKATATDLEPILVLFSDPQGAARALLEQAAVPIVAELTAPDGWHHRLGRLEEPQPIRQLQALLQDQPVVIADGHHRYEVALAYRDERRAAGAGCGAGFNFKMMLFVAADDPGLELLPIHRLVRRLPVPPPQLKARLESYFDLCPVRAPERLANDLAATDPPPRFGLALNDELLRLDLKPGLEAALPWPPQAGATERRVEVALFTTLVLQHLLGIGESELAASGTVDYTHSWTEAIEGVRSARHQAAFFLRPLPAETFWQAVRDGVVLPRKSTHFRPKPLSGLAFAELD